MLSWSVRQQSCRPPIRKAVSRLLKLMDMEHKFLTGQFDLFFDLAAMTISTDRDQAYLRFACQFELPFAARGAALDSTKFKYMFCDLL